MSSPTGRPLPSLANDDDPEDENTNKEKERPDRRDEEVASCGSEPQQQHQQHHRRQQQEPTLESLPIRERTKASSLLFNQSSFFPFVGHSTNDGKEKEEKMDDVETGTVVADFAVEEYGNHQDNESNSCDTSTVESIITVPIPRLERYVVSALSPSVESASQRSMPGAFAVQGIYQDDEEEDTDDDDSRDFTCPGIGTATVNITRLHHTYNDHDIMVEANVVDEAAEEAERKETMNLRKETSNLRLQLEQLKNENIALRVVERRPGTCFMLNRRFLSVGCTFFLLSVVLLLMFILPGKSSNNHSVSTSTPSPTAITFESTLESTPAVPSSQPSHAFRPFLQPSYSTPTSLQKSLRPTSPPSVHPLFGPVEWTSIVGDVIGNDPGDFLGYHVDISGNGNRMAVVTYVNFFRRVRLYELAAASTTITGSTWKQLGDDIDNATDVVMDETGSTIAVGNHNSGTVTAYTWNTNTNKWNQLGSVFTGYGSPAVFSMSSDGRQLAIGDAYSDDSLNGQVVVFSWDDAAEEWKSMGDALLGYNSFDKFGTAVSLSGDGTRMVVGAALVDDMNVLKVGRIQVFEWNHRMSSWRQHGQIMTGNNEAISNELFGHAFEMSNDGTTIVVGASLSSQGGGTFSGRAVVYRYDEKSNRWMQLGDELLGENTHDRFGSSVSISSNGNRIAIGAYSNDNDDIGEDVGHVRVFDWNGSNWIQSGNDVIGDSMNDRFGWSIGLSNDGTRMVVSALWHDCPNIDDDLVATRCGLVRTYDAKAPTFRS